MIKSACIVAGTILISGPSIAQKLDRVGVMEAVRQDCPRQFLPDKTLIDALLLGGGSLSKFCECVAARVASQLDDSDHGNINALTAYNSKLMASRTFCLAVSSKIK